MFIGAKSGKISCTTKNNGPFWSIHITHQACNVTGRRRTHPHQSTGPRAPGPATLGSKMSVTSKPPEYPVFKVITACLSDPDGHDDYDLVMQDVYVWQTGRYELIGRPRESVDPSDGAVLTVVEVVDHGPRDQGPARY